MKFFAKLKLTTFATLTTFTAFVTFATSWMQTFSDEHMKALQGFVSATPQKRLIGVGRTFMQFDYEKLGNPMLTDDNPIFSALYNPTSNTFITAAGHDVKIWDAKNGVLIRKYRKLSDTDLTALCLDGT